MNMCWYLLVDYHVFCLVCSMKSSEIENSHAPTHHYRFWWDHYSCSRFQSKDSQDMHRFLSGCYATPFCHWLFHTHLYFEAPGTGSFLVSVAVLESDMPPWRQPKKPTVDSSKWTSGYEFVGESPENTINWGFISPPMSSGVWGLSIQSRISWRSQAWISYDFMTRSPDATGNSFPNDQWL